MEQYDKVFCPVCHLAVAHFDPARIQRGLHVYHLPCLKKRLEQAQEAQRRIDEAERRRNKALPFD
jgi:hypothetical protein